MILSLDILSNAIHIARENGWFLWEPSPPKGDHSRILPPLHPLLHEHTFLCESVICVKAQNKKRDNDSRRHPSNTFSRLFSCHYLRWVIYLRFSIFGFGSCGLFTSGGLCLPAVLILLHPRVLLHSFRGNGRGGFRAVAYLRVGRACGDSAPRFTARQARTHCHANQHSW